MTQAIRTAFHDNGHILYNPVSAGLGAAAYGATAALIGMNIPIAAAATFGAPFLGVTLFVSNSLARYKDSLPMTIAKLALSILAGFAASMLVSVGLSYWGISITLSQGAVLALASVIPLFAFILAIGFIDESCCKGP